MPSSLTRSTQNPARRDRENLFVAGACARSIAELAKNAGYSLSTSDLFCDWDTQQYSRCQRVNGLAEMGEILKEHSYDELLIAGGMENFPECVERFSCRFPARNLASLVRCRDPFAIAETVHNSRRLRQQNVEFPDTRCKLGDRESQSNWLSKSRLGAGGTGVVPLDRTNANSSDRFAQKLVRGQSVGALFLGDGSSSRLLGTSHHLHGVEAFGSPGFAYCGSVLITNLNMQLSDRICQIGRTFVHEFGLRGVFGIDLIVGRQKIWILEINPRITAAAEIIAPSLDSETDLITAHLRGLRGELALSGMEDSSKLNCDTFGKAIIYNRTKQSIMVSSAEFNAFKAWFQSASSPSGITGGVRDIPVAGVSIGPNCPIVTVLAQAHNTQATQQKLLTLAREVHSIVQPQR